uniref:Uncharacterized protein n=1 Tax=Amphimedon queenslandica TaxID=400682 RepID=A0A1X7TXJ0_AMPQE
MAEPVEDGSREELVSTLMNISETLCKKAMAIEESGLAKVRRGRALQEKNKHSFSTDRRKRTNELE